MLLELFESLKGVLKLDPCCIDNNVFRLHYKVTVLMLAALSLLVTSSQLFGDPIDCISNDDIPHELLDTYCWIHSTFTLPNALNKKVGVEIPAPGVDKYTPGEDRVYHMYYQWVCFVLFLQAILFYVPRYLWKSWEGKRIRSLVMDFNTPVLTLDKKNETKDLLVAHLKENFNNHGMYFFYYFLSEVMNFVNVIGQMYMIDTFLGGQFTTYGIQVIQFSEMEQEDRVDPMVKVFPRLTKCTFHRYGSSGDVQRHDAICLLPLNILNEKIYIILWFWFVFLAVISGIMLVYRVTIILWPRSRLLLLRFRARLANKRNIEIIIQHCKIGDWFILDLLCKNIDSLHFRDVVADLAKELEDSKPLLNKEDFMARGD
ncbi:innexin inx2-like [Limulus polyphemus]|uniref:Innexin n=1 Tax=Limulus polyphemus TaxID=6850 RepID=A0ABM1B2P6_LIMPO|nr:innexin inx2-like [Limulus polyphemus]